MITHAQHGTSADLLMDENLSFRFHHASDNSLEVILIEETRRHGAIALTLSIVDFDRPVID